MVKDISPYWNTHGVEISKRLVSSINPKEKLSSSILDSHCEKWGRHTLLKTSGNKRTRKYKLSLQKSQQDTLKQWMEDSLLIYNVTVKKLEGTSEKINKTMKYELRDDFTIKKNSTQKDPEIILSMDRTPQKVREKANFEAILSHNLSLSKTTISNPFLTRKR